MLCLHMHVVCVNCWWAIHKGEDHAWFVITQVYPETKLPMTDQAPHCSELITAICTQLEEFGAMTFETTRKCMGGWLSEVKSNGRAIIEGTRGHNGRPSTKGKFWELRTTATEPLVDMVMYEELSEKRRAHSKIRVQSISPAGIRRKVRQPMIYHLSLL